MGYLGDLTRSLGYLKPADLNRVEAAYHLAD